VKADEEKRKRALERAWHPHRQTQPAMFAQAFEEPRKLVPFPLARPANARRLLPPSPKPIAAPSVFRSIIARSIKGNPIPYRYIYTACNLPPPRSPPLSRFIQTPSSILPALRSSASSPLLHHSLPPVHHLNHLSHTLTPSSHSASPTSPPDPPRQATCSPSKTARS
jgi:hypothetical protein